MHETRLVLVLSNTGQWEDKTEEIAAYVADPAKGEVRIKYRANPVREYRYRHDRVRMLVATATLNPLEVQLRVDGRLLAGADAIIKFPNFYLVIEQGVRT